MVTIKKATEKDIATIQDLAKESWQDAYHDILSQDQINYMLDKMYADKELLTHFNNDNYHYYLILNKDRPIGFIGFEHFKQERLTKLHRIYLIPDSKGIGAGKTALNFVKDATLSNHNSRLILTVNKNNTALHFYESQGFKVYDKAVFDIGEGYVMDDFLMEYFV